MAAFFEEPMCFFTSQSEMPRWVQMWILAVAVFFQLKFLSWAYRRPVAAPMWKHVGYLLAWPGMDADAFLGGQPAARPTLGEWLFAALKTLFAIVVLRFVCPAVAQYGFNVLGWVAMVGIVFALHFGSFHLLSCGWRTLGVRAVPITNWPIVAQNLPDFWGRRWNLAFRDLMNRFVFQPLVHHVAPPVALLASFVVSGLVHDLVISIPAGGGYGLPTLYFTLQGLALLAQRTRAAAVLHLHRGVWGRLVTFAVLVLPCPLLFHHWFVHRVVVPFILTMRP